MKHSHYFKWVNWLLDGLAPIVGLIARLYIARVFLLSGWVKVQSWESTKLLFSHEYQVPFLEPDVAAFLGTTAEILLPLLLIIGFMGRLSALGLFFLNLVAIISYPYLFTAEGHSGLMMHVQWGIILMLLMVHGVGSCSLDAWLKRRYCEKSEQNDT